MGLWLRAVTAHPDDRVGFPAPTGQLASMRDYNSRASDALSWPLRAPGKQVMARHIRAKYSYR